MVIECPKCRHAFEYDDAIVDADEVVKTGHVRLWCCDHCGELFHVGITITPVETREQLAEI